MTEKMFDPFICLAKCFSTWYSITVLMGFILAFLIIDLSLSAWGTTSAGSSFVKLTVNGTRPYNNWGSVVCESVPYVYLRPFAFTYSTQSGYVEHLPSYCSFPTSNSEFRLTICTFAIVLVSLLYIRTPLSLAARPIFMTFSLLFFAAAVLDISSTVTGFDTCHQSFINTQLNVDITAAQYTISCNADPYIALCCFDLILFLFFAFLFTAWLFCKDKYTKPKPEVLTDDEKVLLGKNVPSSSA